MYTFAQRLASVTDAGARQTAAKLLKEVQEWDSDATVIEAINYDISLKVSGKVFGYLSPRRKHFVVYSYDDEDEWKGFPVHQGEGLEIARRVLHDNYEEMR